MALAKTDMMVVITLNNLQIKFNSFNFEDTSKHINKMPFSGVCMFTDKPSDGAPCGADKPVAFSKEAVTKALDTFVGMGVNCCYDYPAGSLTGHDERFKIGVVEEATLNEDGNVFIKGSLWRKDFYDVCFMIKNAKDSLGFSVEVCVNGMEETSDFYLVKDFTFTGVAILYKNLAAFQGTQLAAQRRKEDAVMDKEQFAQFMSAVNSINDGIKGVSEKLSALEAKETKIDFSKVKEIMEEVAGEFEAKFSAQKSQQVVPKQKDPAPKAQNTFVGKNAGELSFAEQCEAIDKDNAIPAEMKAHEKVVAYFASLKKSK